MISENPFGEFRHECQTALANALDKALPEIKHPAITLNKTPNIEYGQLASSLCFELAKKLGQKPLVLAQQLVDAHAGPPGGEGGNFSGRSFRRDIHAQQPRQFRD